MSLFLGILKIIHPGISRGLMLLKQTTPTSTVKDESKQQPSSNVASFFINQFLHFIITQNNMDNKMNIFQNLTLSEKIVVPMALLTDSHLILITQFHAHVGEVIGNESGQWLVLTPHDEMIEVTPNPYQLADKIRTQFLQSFLQEQDPTLTLDLQAILDVVQAWTCFPDGITYNSSQLHPDSRQWFQVMTPTRIQKWITTASTTNDDLPENKLQGTTRNDLMKRLLQFLQAHARVINTKIRVTPPSSSSPSPTQSLVRMKETVRWFCDSCPASCKGQRIRQWTPEEMTQALDILKLHYLLFEYHCAMKGHLILEDVICYIRSFFFHAARKFNLQLSMKQKAELQEKLQLLKKKLDYNNESTDNPSASRP